MTGREDSENEEYKPAEKQQPDNRHLQVPRGVYGRRDTYDAVESFGTGAFNTVYLNFIYCAVPCFFMASGYLLAGRMEWPLTAKDNLPKVAHAFFKMLKLYLLWSLAYLPLAIFDYRRSGLGVREAAIRYIKGLVFSGEHYGSWMLWYMISAIYALGIIYLLLKIKVNPWAITALGLVFILCGAALDMLSGTTNDISPAINFIRKLMWATTGNGKVFRGLFYISFGMLLTKIKIPVWADVLITLFGFAGCVAFNKYTGFFVILCAVGLFGIIISVKVPYVSDRKILRRASMIIYFMHLYVYMILVLRFGLHSGKRAFLIVALITTAIAFAYIAICDLIKRKNAVKCKEKA